MAPPMGRANADKRAMKQNMDLFLSKSVRGINNTRMANASRWMWEAGQRKGKTMMTPMERAKAKEGAVRHNMDIFLSMTKQGGYHAHVPVQLSLTQHALL